MAEPAALAHIGGRRATGLQDVTSDLAALDGTGFWVVVVTFEGTVSCARFADVLPAPVPDIGWSGPQWDSWSSTMDQPAYVAAVRRVQAAIAAGDVYQVNVCRILSAPLSPDADVMGLARRLAVGNPAPFAATVRLPAQRLHIASASPELYLRRRGRVVESGPIKGTAPTPAQLLPKDVAENVMIVDLVRNDLGRVARTGSVTVPALCRVEQHPGLAHLVSTVRAELRPGAGWADLLAASFPPGSVTGAPKSSALRLIDEIEPASRGPYCGAIGWVDADRQEGELAVAIRTFWHADDRLCFGTGAGITWGSDPAGEWAETELKAARLLGLASPRGGDVVDPTSQQRRPSHSDNNGHHNGDNASDNNSDEEPDVNVWLNDKLVDADDAQVSAFDHGLTVGDGVFETIKVVAGEPFALTRHLRRLEMSARGLGLPAPDEGRIRHAVASVLSGVSGSARLRVTYTGGASPLGSERGTAGPTLVVATAPLPTRDPTTMVVTVPWRRNEHGAIAGLKTTSYAENVIALAAARRRGASEALFANTAGDLCEGTGTNVFLVLDGGPVTPPLSSGCLAGVTRALVLEWVEAEEAAVPVTALDDAEEVFLTSTTRDVQPVHAVDDRRFTAPGPVTAKVMAVFAERAAESSDP